MSISDGGSVEKIRRKLEILKCLKPENQERFLKISAIFFNAKYLLKKKKKK